MEIKNITDINKYKPITKEEAEKRLSCVHSDLMRVKEEYEANKCK